MSEELEATPAPADSDWGFTPALAPESHTPQTVAAAARELGTISAMVQAAQARPRDEYAIVQRVAKACQRPALAEKAEYAFSRAGTRVTGPSSTFARFLAAQWGNLRYSVEIVEDTPDRRHLRGWAHDLQTNSMVSNEHVFSKRVQRKDRKTGVTTWISTDDERDIREMTARWGALLTRNSLLSLIPPDVVDKALKACAHTRLKAAQNALTENRDDVVHRLMFMFGKHGVHVEHVERFLEHPLSALTAEELTTLQGILASIEEGNSSREDIFEIKTAGSQAAAAAQGLVDGLKKKQAVVETPKEVAAEPPEWISMPQQQAIAAAIASGNISDAHVHEYRKRCGLGKGDKMKGAQAAELLAMINDGRVHTLVDDGIKPR